MVKNINTEVAEVYGATMKSKWTGKSLPNGSLHQIVNARPREKKKNIKFFSEKRSLTNPCWIYLMTYSIDDENDAANEDKAYSLHPTFFAAENYAPPLPWVPEEMKKVYVSRSLLNKIYCQKDRAIFVRPIE